MGVCRKVNHSLYVTCSLLYCVQTMTGMNAIIYTYSRYIDVLFHVNGVGIQWYTCSQINMFRQVYIQNFIFAQYMIAQSTVVIDSLNIGRMLFFVCLFCLFIFHLRDSKASTICVHRVPRHCQAYCRSRSFYRL
jgi:hypothetical protein